MSDRYRRGIDVAGQLAAEKLDQFLSSGIAEVAPDFARMTIEFAFGDLYSRNSLDLRSRELIAIAALATRGNAMSQLRGHIRAAASVGITREEVVEVLMQTALYAGFPAALNALTDCHDLLTDGSCLAGGCG
ncbi:MAG TPA: carboxymuconolactone decarboxylase family protein [Sphingomicrobium sp.]